MRELRIKRGETLNLAFQFTDDGAPWDIGLVTLSSQVRAADGTLVSTLTMVKQETLGLATAQVVDTSDWPAGRLRADVHAAVSGQNVFSETFAIEVARQVTRS